MRHAERTERLATLRERVGALEAGERARPVLAFGIEDLDRHLPEGGLRLGALHEVATEGADGGALPVLFAASLLARLEGPILWCLGRSDLFAPGLAAVGLHPDRVLYAEARREADLLAAMEEGLRHRGLAAVVAEVGPLGLTASRRLQLAAEASGCLALTLRRGVTASESSAAFTRWRVVPAPCPPLPVPGLLRARWRVALVRARGAGPRAWIVEAPDATGRLRLPADVADRPLAAPAWRAAAG